MWKEIALAGTVILVPAAASQLLKDPPAARTAVAAPPAGAAFKPTCSSGEVLDSRPDPAWVSKSFDNDNCREPAFPTAFDGARVPREKIVAAMAAAHSYAAATQVFRKCVSDFVLARTTALTPSQRIIETHRILVSQRSSQRAIAQMQAAVVAFNAYGSGCEDP